MKKSLFWERLAWLWVLLIMPAVAGSFTTTIGTAQINQVLASPGPIGNVTPNTVTGTTITGTSLNGPLSTGTIAAGVTGGAGLVPTNATNATNATNLTGSGTISTTTTGGGGLSVLNAVNIPGVVTTATGIQNGVAAVTQALGNSTTNVATTAFVNPGSSIAANGYRKFPDGLMVAWGAISVSTTDTNVSLPFPTAGFSVVLTPVTGGITAQVIALTNSYFTLNTSGAGTYYWQAYGN